MDEFSINIPMLLVKICPLLRLSDPSSLRPLFLGAIVAVTRIHELCPRLLVNDSLLETIQRPQKILIMVLLDGHYFVLYCLARFLFCVFYDDVVGSVEILSSQRRAQDLTSSVCADSMFFVSDEFR